MKKIYLIFTVIFLVSCHKGDKFIDDKSLIFSFHHWGSWIGLEENLSINAGATHYSIGYRNLRTSKDIRYETTAETSNELWNYLLKNFNLNTFTQIKDGACRACLDGFDSSFSVTIDGKTFSFYNGDDDVYFKQMQSFFDAIIEQADLLDKTKLRAPQ